MLCLEMSVGCTIKRRIMCDDRHYREGLIDFHISEVQIFQVFCLSFTANVRFATSSGLLLTSSGLLLTYSVLTGVKTVNC